MSLVTPNTVLDHTDVTDPDEAKKVAQYGTQAEKRMRRLLTYSAEGGVGQIVPQGEGLNVGDLYDDIVDLKNDFTQSDKDLLKEAETLYAYGEAIPFLGLHRADGGGYVETTGFDQSRTRYKQYDEIRRFASDMKAQGVRLARSLKPQGEQVPTWVL